MSKGKPKKDSKRVRVFAVRMDEKRSKKLDEHLDNNGISFPEWVRRHVDKL